ncbi:MAG: hypothetical protein A2848_02965 [Candidatus Magasanikbacteria bacterium RIFCSPHIGHO2_01_FULL_50_8]|uniref:Thymidylate synthase n=2 Tax=Candidatus Magasanikiibacteriota TaxID=1752731 RepID=A0A1F6LRN8_9BACT|nr:MAG: hypothetical protein A2848_02965 [Candidatus Magasanikbacteria bacterium RIFCSPHIGHO2_01_FULL_50_8]OGH67482.1 MAG: hypothetical protein A3C15_01870 [Candidatus Magasanikbacteria bacterium RIFCSPHIGHO2_02_FULL_50_9b]
MPLESHDRDIFAITGLSPEVQAVAFAKYSRSQESVKTTIDDLTDEKSAEFHEKWVIGYGDASVADMAMIAVALENVSMLASKSIEDHRLASYQEKSSRYVPFDPTRFHKPDVFMAHDAMRETYIRAVESLMAGYVALTDGMIAYFRAKYPKPDDMLDKPYENKLRARSLDVARYVMPVATLTNIGMLASAREIRYMSARLKASPQGEIRAIGDELQRAALEPAYNPQNKKIEPLLVRLLDGGADQNLIDELRTALRLSIRGAPTLIKHTEPREYLLKKDRIAKVAGMFLGDECVADDEPRVDLVSNVSPENELIASLLYPHTACSFRTLADRAEKLSASQKRALISAVNDNRTSHDNLSREFEVGNYFIFDTLMDYGGYCDMQRHRLTSQLTQPLSPVYGYEIPRDLADAGLLSRFEQLLEDNRAAFETLASFNADEARFVLAKAWRKRTVFKMNLRELYHIVELRSRSGGHFSYRTLVYDMYERVRAHHPLLVEHLRAVKMDFDADFFGR